MTPAPVTVVVPLPPSYRGGTEQYAYALVERYARRIPVRVRTTSVRWDPEAPGLPTGGAEVRRMAGREVLERPLVLSWAARRELATTVRGSTLLQLHMPFPGIERSVVRTARKAGVPTVLTYHMDADLAAAGGGPLSRGVTALYRWASAHPTIDAADVVVSNSLGYARSSPVLSRHLSKVRVIPKGVDPGRLGLSSPPTTRVRPPRVRAEMVPPDHHVLAFVGRLVPYKGLPVLLEAVAMLRAEGRKLVLLIAGRGPELGRLRERTRTLGLQQVVRFLGFVPDDQLGDLYRFADVITIPSVSSLEATATTLEEAVACGTPVVGTRLPGTEETVPDDGRRGILVPPKDTAALARGIDRILRAERPMPPERVRTWDHVAEDYWQLFLEFDAKIARPAVPTTALESEPVPRGAPPIRAPRALGFPCSDSAPAGPPPRSARVLASPSVHQTGNEV